MINGIMKLFYTEVVKNKMSKLPNGQYEVNDQFKKVQGISIKIDKVLFLVFKILIALVVLFVASKINIYFGIGVFLTEIIYVLYKKSLKPKVVSEIENIKNNINTNGEQILKQKGKKDISFLISISAEKFCLPLTSSCTLLRSCSANRRFRKSMSCV